MRLIEHTGGVPCESTFSIGRTFIKKPNEVPFSIYGMFYHSHENDAKYHREESGGWKTHSSKPTKTGIKRRLADKPRLKNGQVFPLSARLAGVTKEDILKARVNRSPGFGKRHESRKAKSKRKKKCDKDL